MSQTLAGNNFYFFRPRRVWLLTSRLGTGKLLTFVYSVRQNVALHNVFKKNLAIFRPQPGCHEPWPEIIYIFPEQGEFGR
jgi:hypothetical protein